MTGPMKQLRRLLNANKKGAVAFLAGKTKDANPYRSKAHRVNLLKPLRDAWDEGYDQARESTK